MLLLSGVVEMEPEPEAPDCEDCCWSTLEPDEPDEDPPIELEPPIEPDVLPDDDPDVEGELDIEAEPDDEGEPDVEAEPLAEPVLDNPSLWPEVLEVD